MGVLVISITPEVRETVKRVIEYAVEHVYRPPGGPVPGEVPEHVCVLFGMLRCVFSFTVIDGVTYRHLSVSPWPFNSALFLVIAELFGFSKDAAYGINDDVPCVVALQPLLAAPIVVDPL